MESQLRHYSDYQFYIGISEGDFRIFYHIDNNTYNLEIVLVDNSHYIR